MYYNEKLIENKKKPKELWKFINAIIPSKRSTNESIPKIKIENSITENPKEISEHFNSFFTKIGHSIANNIDTVVQIQPITIPT